MASLRVFDRPLCCSTGICGPDVDPALVAFAADLQWLARKGVDVERINPAWQPTEFAADATVRAELEAHGQGCLPLVIVDGSVVSRGEIPNRARLAAWTGTPMESSLDLPVMQSGCCDDGDGSCCT